MGASTMSLAILEFKRYIPRLRPIIPVEAQLGRRSLNAQVPRAEMGRLASQLEIGPLLCALSSRTASNRPRMSWALRKHGEMGSSNAPLVRIL